MTVLDAVFVTFFTLVFVTFAVSLFAIDRWCNAPRHGRAVEADRKEPTHALPGTGTISPA